MVKVVSYETLREFTCRVDDGPDHPTDAATKVCSAPPACIEQQLSGHPEWREGIAHGKHNAESLSETLSALLAFYEMGKHAADAGDVLRNEPEFTQYWLIYFLDQEQGAEAGRLLTVLALKRPLLRESDAVRRAAEIKRCREERNYARFFGLVREAPYLVRCLAVAQYADGMRLDALEVMGKAYVKSEPYPAGELADLLCLSGPEEARRRVDDAERRALLADDEPVPQAP